MFPPLRVRLSGLEDDVIYDVMLDVLPVDNRRYRYAYHRSSWVVSDRAPVDGAEAPGRADDDAVRSYRHPDGPFSAGQLMQRTVSFDRVKLTNNRTNNKNGYVSSSLVTAARPYSFLGGTTKIFSPASPFEFSFRFIALGILLVIIVLHRNYVNHSCDILWHVYSELCQVLLSFV